MQFSEQLPWTKSSCSPSCILLPHTDDMAIVFLIRTILSENLFFYDESKIVLQRRVLPAIRKKKGLMLGFSARVGV